MDRSETIKQEMVDRLSPLTSTITISGQFGMQAADAEFEKFTADFDVEPNGLQPRQHSADTTQLTVNANGNIRRHTVGPGDVAHEQALGNPVNVMNFKFDGRMMGPNQIPINLPMLQNHPINTFTVKDQHLLKPPTVMGASRLKAFYGLQQFFIVSFFSWHIWSTSFGWRSQLAHILLINDEQPWNSDRQ